MPDHHRIMALRCRAGKGPCRHATKPSGVTMLLCVHGTQRLGSKQACRRSGGSHQQLPKCCLSHHQFLSALSPHDAPRAGAKQLDRANAAQLVHREPSKKCLSLLTACFSDCQTPFPCLAGGARIGAVGLNVILSEGAERPSVQGILSFAPSKRASIWGQSLSAISCVSSFLNWWSKEWFWLGSRTCVIGSKGAEQPSVHGVLSFAPSKHASIWGQSLSAISCVPW
jgi:hypothetical protein